MDRLLEKRVEQNEGVDQEHDPAESAVLDAILHLVPTVLDVKNDPEQEVEDDRGEVRAQHRPVAQRHLPRVRFGEALLLHHLEDYVLLLAPAVAQDERHARNEQVQEAETVLHDNDVRHDRNDLQGAHARCVPRHWPDFDLVVLVLEVAR